MGGLSRKSVLPALLVYTFLALIFTFPLALHISTHIIGGVNEDAAHYIWNFWWFNKSIFDLRVSPFYSDYLFFPWGIPLIFQMRGPAELLVSLFLTRLGIPLIVIYNTFVILSFPLAGICTLFLVYQLTKNYAASFLAGVIYSFSSIRAERLSGHFPLLLGYWIPLNIYFFFRLRHKKTLLNHCFFALSFLMAGYSDVQLAIMLGMFYCIKVAVHLGRQKLGTSLVLKSLMSYLPSFGLLFTGFFPMLQAAFSFSKTEMFESLVGWGGAESLGVDVLAFFLPPSDNLFFGFFTRGLLGSLSMEWESTVAYVGVFALISVVVLIVRKLHRNTSVFDWLLTWAVFLIFALGPRLNIAGRGLFSLDGLNFSWSPPLPFAIFHFLPFLQHFRTPGRLMIMVSLSTAVLVGYLFAKVLPRIRVKCRLLLAFCLTLLFFLDGFKLLDLTSPSVSAFYYNLGNESQEYTILEIPLVIRGRYSDLGQTDARFMYDQTIHNKRVLGGYIISVPDKYFVKAREDPVLGSIVLLQNDPSSISSLPQVSQLEVEKFLRIYSPRYIVLRSPFNTSWQMRRLLRDTFHLKEVFSNGAITAFEILNE